MQNTITYWILVLAGCILISSKCKASSCGSTCPGSVEPPEPSTRTEQYHVTAIKCQLVCVQKYYDNPQLVTTYAVWPSYNHTALSQDCKSFHKVEQCRMGCIIGANDSQLTINQCRNKCYSNCNASCSGALSCTLPNLPCERKCKKPVCRIGCHLSHSLQGGYVPQSPLAAPILSPAPPSDSVIPTQYHISIPDRGVPTGGTANQAVAVNFLFKVVELEENITWYYWQTDLTQTLKLQAFTCRQVDVSFAVVSNTTVSQYSPVTRTCIIDSSLFPSRVSKYTVQYAEDTRAGFAGRAVVKLNWTMPEGHTKITSYSINILSPSDECGGYQSIYLFDNIQPNTTEITIRANQSFGFLKFGCTYPTNLNVYPALEGHSTTYIQLVPTLDDNRPPDMNLRCSREQQNDGSMRVTLMWTVPPPSMNLEAIGEFHIIVTSFSKPSQQPEPAAQYGTAHVPIQMNTFTYTHTLSISSNRVMVNHTYRFLVRPLQNEQYSWRHTPNEVACELVATPALPLTPVKDVSITEFNHIHRNLIKFTATWIPSAIFQTHYELIVTEGNARNGTVVSRTRLPANQTSANIELQLGENITAHCLYLQVRAYRWSHSSNPSKTLVLPRDSQCVNSSVDYDFSTASGEEGRITVYYEGEESATKIFDIGCSGVDERSFTSFDLDERLTKIEDKLDQLSRYFGIGTNNLSLNAQLAALNQKLDSILTLHGSDQK